MDALVEKPNRSRRRPASSGDAIKPTPGDDIVFDILHRIGDQSTQHLIDLRKCHGFTDQSASEKRLSLLHYEDNHPDRLPGLPDHIYGERYLALPGAQFKTDASNQSHSHMLGVAAERRLKRLGRWHEGTPRKTNEWWHDFQNSTLIMEIYLHCRQHPDLYKFHFHDEMPKTEFAVSYQDARGHTRKPFIMKSGEPRPNLRPDYVFSIEYLKTGKTLYYCVETDRGNENLSSTSGRKTVEDNVYQYMQFIGEKEHHKHFDGAMIALFFLNSPGRMKNLLSILPDTNYICFLADPFWNTDVPKVPPKHQLREYADLLWLRPGRTPFDIFNPQK